MYDIKTDTNYNVQTNLGNLLQVGDCAGPGRKRIVCKMVFKSRELMEEYMQKTDFAMGFNMVYRGNMTFKLF